MLKGLNDAGFHRPSPIQLRAIPLGRFGTDLVAQAKSGTGKTCVFAVIILEQVKLDLDATQALVLCPTREIAIQACHVINTIGKYLSGLQCFAFVGGLSKAHDTKHAKVAHVACGTPGRVKDLIESSHILAKSIRLAVLDEADQMLDDHFQAQVASILFKLPARRQTLMLSATFSPGVMSAAEKFLRQPQFVMLKGDQVSLHGVKQFVVFVDASQCQADEENALHDEDTPAARPGLAVTKGSLTPSGNSSNLATFRPASSRAVFLAQVKYLLAVLSTVSFHQCVVFSNQRAKACFWYYYLYLIVIMVVRPRSWWSY